MILRESKMNHYLCDTKNLSTMVIHAGAPADICLKDPPIEG